MSRYNHLPIFQDVYKLTLEIYIATDKFPRKEKYSLGQKLKEITSSLLDLIIIANSKKDKVLTLEKAQLTLERLQIHLRIACDLKILGLKRFENFSRMIENIRKEITGWKKWSKEN